MACYLLAICIVSAGFLRDGLSVSAISFSSFLLGSTPGLPADRSASLSRCHATPSVGSFERALRAQPQTIPESDYLKAAAVALL